MSIFKIRINTVRAYTSIHELCTLYRCSSRTTILTLSYTQASCFLSAQELRTLMPSSNIQIKSWESEKLFVVFCRMIPAIATKTYRIGWNSMKSNRWVSLKSIGRNFLSDTEDLINTRRKSAKCQMTFVAKSEMTDSKSTSRRDYRG